MKASSELGLKGKFGILEARPFMVLVFGKVGKALSLRAPWCFSSSKLGAGLHELAIHGIRDLGGKVKGC